MLQHAFLCGITVGLFAAWSALRAGAPVATAEGLWMVLLAALAHGLATAMLVAAAAPWWRRRELRTPAPEQMLRRRWALPAAAAAAVLIAALRLRLLAGFANQQLLPLAPGPLLEGAGAALLVFALVSRWPARWSRRLWSAAVVVAAAGAGAAALAGAGQPPAAANPTATVLPTSVLLVSVDTLRADHLGAYGRAPSFTANLDRLAAESALFEWAIAPVALTGPSHTTMLTGLYPARHGATRNGEHPRPEVATLPELLARRGYRTAGFVSSWVLSDAFSGLASRFLTYDENLRTEPWFPGVCERVPLLWLVDRTRIYLRHRGENRGRDGLFQGPIFERDGAVTVERALRFVARQQGRPYFAFVHLYEPHEPYRAAREHRQAVDPGYSGELDEYHFAGGPQRMRRLFDEPGAQRRIAALYEAEVAAADARVGQLLAGLERLGRDRDTLVVFVADHGEGLGEHGELFDHGKYLYDVTLRVPWLIRWPDRRHAGRRVTEPVRLVDLAPTVLALLGERPLRDADGVSLLPLLAGATTSPSPPAFGSVILDRGHRLERHFVRTMEHKLIWNYDDRASWRDEPAFEELYDLARDPGEIVNLLLGAPPPAAADALREELRRWVAVPRGAGSEVSAEVREKLRSLGYL